MHFLMKTQESGVWGVTLGMRSQSSNPLLAINSFWFPQEFGDSTISWTFLNELMCSSQSSQSEKVNTVEHITIVTTWSSTLGFKDIGVPSIGGCIPTCQGTMTILSPH